MSSEDQSHTAINIIGFHTRRCSNSGSKTLGPQHSKSCKNCPVFVCAHLLLSTASEITNTMPLRGAVSVKIRMVHSCKVCICTNRTGNFVQAADHQEDIENKVSKHLASHQTTWD